MFGTKSLTQPLISEYEVETPKRATKDQTDAKKRKENKKSNDLTKVDKVFDLEEYGDEDKDEEESSSDPLNKIAQPNKHSHSRSQSPKRQRSRSNLQSFLGLRQRSPSLSPTHSQSDHSCTRSPLIRHYLDSIKVIDNSKQVSRSRSKTPNRHPPRSNHQYSPSPRKSSPLLSTPSPKPDHSRMHSPVIRRHPDSIKVIDKSKQLSQPRSNSPKRRRPRSNHQSSPSPRNNSPSLSISSQKSDHSRMHSPVIRHNPDSIKVIDKSKQLSQPRSNSPKRRRPRSNHQSSPSPRNNSPSLSISSQKSDHSRMHSPVIRHNPDSIKVIDKSKQLSRPRSNSPKRHRPRSNPHSSPSPRNSSPSLSISSPKPDHSVIHAPLIRHHADTMKAIDKLKQLSRPCSKSPKHYRSRSNIRSSLSPRKRFPSLSTVPARPYHSGTRYSKLRHHPDSTKVINKSKQLSRFRSKTPKRSRSKPRSSLSPCQRSPYLKPHHSRTRSPLMGLYSDTIKTIDKSKQLSRPRSKSPKRRRSRSDSRSSPGPRQRSSPLVPPPPKPHHSRSSSNAQLHHGTQQCSFCGSRSNSKDQQSGVSKKIKTKSVGVQTDVLFSPYYNWKCQAIPERISDEVKDKFLKCQAIPERISDGVQDKFPVVQQMFFILPYFNLRISDQVQEIK
ncbi:serine/arginine repetitive matrix protein 1-like [Leptopilina boulardi]|uniref:serine/arginine repetitive matrix protein 1-like n=1 Tax=Leptopilina boulardi TaxID=63433 RepID=UPI0021F5E0E0|nr:serine/arginine repetitive matrix protein 1-like [Leptopilina boulardi]